jgi:hypothetical protein
VRGVQLHLAHGGRAGRQLAVLGRDVALALLHSAAAAAASSTLHCTALHCSELLLLWDLSLLLCCFCTLPITSPELEERGGEGRREIMKEEDE